MPDLQVRKARLTDVPAMLQLINSYAHSGLMLPRTEFEMCENIRDFTVALRERQLAGCAALHFYTPHMGELRSLAVLEQQKAAGVGRRLVEALLEEGRQFGLDVVFAFTYVTPFFQKCGFQEVDRGSLPLKAWKDCLRCPRFNCCDEVAVVCLLSEEAREANRAAAPDGLIHLLSRVAAFTANGDEPIRVPTPAPGGSFQGR